MLLKPEIDLKAFLVTLDKSSTVRVGNGNSILSDTFRKMDSDKDGHISFKEFHEGLQQHFDVKVAEPDAVEIFAILDHSKIGAISFGGNLLRSHNLHSILLFLDRMASWFAQLMCEKYKYFKL